LLLVKSNTFGYKGGNVHNENYVYRSSC
jgi:hypothetical protein